MTVKKLTDAQKKAIDDSYCKHGVSIKRLSEMYKVSPRTIGRVLDEYDDEFNRNYIARLNTPDVSPRQEAMDFDFEMDAYGPLEMLKELYQAIKDGFRIAFTRLFALRDCDGNLIYPTPPKVGYNHNKQDAQNQSTRY